MELVALALAVALVLTVWLFLRVLTCKDEAHEAQIKHLLNRITDPVGAVYETREVEMTPPARLRPPSEDDPYWVSK